MITHNHASDVAKLSIVLLFLLRAIARRHAQGNRHIRDADTSANNPLPRLGLLHARRIRKARQARSGLLMMGGRAVEWPTEPRQTRTCGGSGSTVACRAKAWALTLRAG
jgi:hypothetical protein